ncbi:MAG: helix-turn-helix domain-containing protein [Candidatus Ornithomonoglobus sp.]
MLPMYEIRQTDLTVKRNNYELGFPEHIHKYIEILYVISGRQRVRLRGTDYCVAEGNGMIIFPDTVHSYCGGGDKADVLILICDPKLFGSLFPDFKKLRPHSPMIYEGQISPELRFALNAVSPDSGQEIKFSWTCVILSYIMDIIQFDAATDAPVEDIAYKLVKYIEENFTESITRDTLAERFNVSKCYISKIFTEKFNMNLRNYLGIIRAEYAASLIRTSSETFTTISRLSGFESLRTFNRIFKAVYGMTPKEYKNNISRMMK